MQHRLEESESKTKPDLGKSQNKGLNKHESLSYGHSRRHKIWSPQVGSLKEKKGILLMGAINLMQGLVP